MKIFKRDLANDWADDSDRYEIDLWPYHIGIPSKNPERAKFIDCMRAETDMEYRHSNFDIFFSCKEDAMEFKLKYL